MMLTDLASVLRDAGLQVQEIPGWRTRGRPASTGGFDPVGNLWHHTGARDTNPLSLKDDAAYAKWLAEIGRSDLPAPLCQISVGRNGTCYVCAAGRGNHAGRAKPSGPVPGGDGNTLYLGWECQNTGTEGWTAAQYRAMVVGGAATSKQYGWGFDANRAHRETSYTGKWDPGGLNMGRFRSDIRNCMEGDDMAWLDWPKKDQEAFLDAVSERILGSKINNKGPDGKVQGRVTLENMVTNIERDLDRRFQQLRDDLRGTQN